MHRFAWPAGLESTFSNSVTLGSKSDIACIMCWQHDINLNHRRGHINRKRRKPPGGSSVLALTLTWRLKKSRRLTIMDLTVVRLGNRMAAMQFTGECCNIGYHNSRRRIRTARGLVALQGGISAPEFVRPFRRSESTMSGGQFHIRSLHNNNSCGIRYNRSMLIWAFL